VGPHPYYCYISDICAYLQPGEILVVPFTDIGWSPYFPLVSGLVTEIGGIVTHGTILFAGLIFILF